MTKRKIRYSEFPQSTVAAGTDATPGEIQPGHTRTPIDLARALAAARAEEATTAYAAHRAAGEPTTESCVPAARLARVDVGVGTTRLPPVDGGAIAPAESSINAAPFRSGRPTLRERATTRTGTVELLVCSIGGEWFGIELEAVEEAIDLPTVRHIPEMPPAMLGVVTARGTLTSVYSPARALGISLVGGASALIFSRNRGRLGIVVDDVDDVHTLDLAHLRTAPGAHASDGMLLGVLRYRDALLALVDAEALINACQSEPALETA